MPIRLTLVDPPNGVQYALQKGKEELVSKTQSKGVDLEFDLMVTVAGQLETGAPRFLGDYVQGPPLERFVYITIGTSAGDRNSPWKRRAKLHLSGIEWGLVERFQANPGTVISGRFAGTDKKGEPSCASLRPIDGQWTLL